MEDERDVREEKELEERSVEREVEDERTTVEACEEEERCKEEHLESHSAVKRARVSAVFSDSQETAIVDFVKDHPELYDKENARFHDRHRKEALLSEIAEELNLTAIDVKCWFESQRTRYGKLSKQQSGQAPRQLIRRVLGLLKYGFPEVPHQKERCQQKFGVREKGHQTA